MGNSGHPLALLRQVSNSGAEDQPGRCGTMDGGRNFHPNTIGKMPTSPSSHMSWDLPRARTTLRRETPVRILSGQEEPAG